MKTVTLPKGLIVKYKGLPCELVCDTEVVSDVIAKIGLDAVPELFGDSQEAA